MDLPPHRSRLRCPSMLPNDSRVRGISLGMTPDPSARSSDSAVKASFNGAAPVCIELHDVAPATWPECERALAMLDTIGPVPVTLLIVPNYHGRGSIVEDSAFRNAIDKR